MDIKILPESEVGPRLYSRLGVTEERKVQLFKKMQTATDNLVENMGLIVRKEGMTEGFNVAEGIQLVADIAETIEEFALCYHAFVTSLMRQGLIPVK